MVVRSALRVKPMPSSVGPVKLPLQADSAPGGGGGVGRRATSFHVVVRLLDVAEIETTAGAAVSIRTRTVTAFVLRGASLPILTLAAASVTPSEALVRTATLRAGLRAVLRTFTWRLTQVPGVASIGVVGTFTFSGAPAARAGSPALEGSVSALAGAQVSARARQAEASRTARGTVTWVQHLPTRGIQTSVGKAQRLRRTMSAVSTVANPFHSA